MTEPARERAPDLTVPELAIESLGDARRGNAIVWIAIAGCVIVPGVLFVKLGPGNTFTEIGVAAIFAVLALVLGLALPAKFQRSAAARKLAELRALPGFDVDRYVALLAEPRERGRLLVNLVLAAAPNAGERERVARALAGWHLEWEGATLLAETEPLSGKLVLDGPFKSTNAPAEAFTNAAFHARFAALLAALGPLPATQIRVDIAAGD